MKKNLCGKCNVCCIIFNIDKEFLKWRDTDKAIGEVCDKLSNDKCKCYAIRPKPCRTFDCVWLKLTKEELVRSEWRPDKVGFIVRIINEKEKDLLAIDELEKGSLDLNNVTMEQDEFLQTIFKLAENKITVVIKPFGHDKHYLLRN